MKQIIIFKQGFLIGFKEFGTFNSHFFNFIILTVVYFFGVPIALILSKLTKVNRINSLKGKKTYWKLYNLKEKNPESYLNQF